ncbi:hypothetical protein [Bacillus litorisediminis]|uniref:hypothetical protein n=1 Tax=Bacillus litorisediminis TaxID=2922713 RepID=UPI001FAEDEBE|nr:hypothetical protein [Bacillus litorisediminis]
MEHASKRLQELLDDTLQILDHMEVPEHNHMLLQIKNGLKEQSRKVTELTNYTSEEILGTAVSIGKNLNEISQVVILLEANLLRDYQKSTGDHIDQYQQLSLEKQMEQTETYHDKIDYLSAVKIRENINRMNEVLLRIRS